MYNGYLLTFVSKNITDIDSLGKCLIHLNNREYMLLNNLFVGYMVSHILVRGSVTCRLRTGDWNWIFCLHCNLQDAKVGLRRYKLTTEVYFKLNCVYHDGNSDSCVPFKGGLRHWKCVHHCTVNWLRWNILYTNILSNKCVHFFQMMFDTNNYLAYIYAYGFLLVNLFLPFS